MKEYLGFVVCESFAEEIKHVITKLEMKNILVAAFYSQCKSNKKQGKTIIQAIEDLNDKCSKIIIMGGSCCIGLEKLYENEKYKIQKFEHCFQMLINKEIIEFLIHQKAYIVSPSWLKNWRSNIKLMGFNKENAEIFFKECAAKISLLNTNIYENSLDKLREFAEFVNLPYDYIPVGLDVPSMIIENNILEWKLENSRKEKIDCIAKENVEFADRLMVLDLISDLTQIMSEADAIHNVENLFNLFYGPKESVYIPADNKNFADDDDELINPNEECIWDDSKNGFVLKITYKNRMLGKLKIYEVAHPEHKDYYVNLATTIGRVCGLAIANARKYEKQRSTGKSINKEKEKLLYILNSLPDGVCIIDSDFKFLYSNKASLDFIEINKADSIIGKSIFDFIHPDYQEIVLKRLQKVLSTRTLAPLEEIDLLTNNGNTLTVEIASGAFEYDGNLCIFNVSRDISERINSEKLKEEILKQTKLLDEAKECDKLKTEFLANLSHELRTPLTVLFSTIQLLDYVEADTTRIKRYNNIMKQNCYRLLRLVDNLIDLTKIDAGFFTLNLRNRNIVEIIEDITSSVVEYAANKGIEIIFDTEIEEKIIACDADMLERIVLNLLSNAIKFTPGGGKIFINIKDSDSSVFVSVKDTGIGIPLDKQKYIFDRFIQVDKSFTRNNEGSGIGLSLAKSLVELHGGFISVISEPLKGSEFIFELPAKVLNDEENSIPDSLINSQNLIERITIEFSDIYD